MNAINTSLTTSGNSVAVRLPKELLRMSGLGSRVQLEAKKGKIIISKASSPRQNWDEQIQQLIVENGDPTLEFAEIHTTSHDGLDGLAWDGLSFEEWQQENGRLS